MTMSDLLKSLSQIGPYKISSCEYQIPQLPKKQLEREVKSRIGYKELTIKREEFDQPFQFEEFRELPDSILIPVDIEIVPFDLIFTLTYGGSEYELHINFINRRIGISPQSDDYTTRVPVQLSRRIRDEIRAYGFKLRIKQDVI